MEMYQIDVSGELKIKDSMIEAFDIDLTRRQVISFVGAGGKTTSIYHLAKEIAALGKRVSITTSTHMFLPAEYGVLVEDKDLLLSMLDSFGIAIVGTPSEYGKMTKVSHEFYEYLKTVSDFVLVEADGSKRLPIKVPDNHEPVIPSDTDLVIVVAGLTSLYRPLMECCHRWNLALDILSCQPSHRITPSDVAKLIIDGYCNKISEPYKILLNQFEEEEKRKAALEIINYLNDYGIEYNKVVTGSFLGNNDLA